MERRSEALDRTRIRWLRGTNGVLRRTVSQIPRTTAVTGAGASLPLRQALKYALWIGLLLGALTISPILSVMAFFGLSGWSLVGAKQALQSLTLVLLIKLLNPALYPNAGGLAVWGWLAVGAAGVGVMREYGRGLSKVPLPVLPGLFLFGVVVLFESFLFSQYPVVSVFKLLSFVWAFATILVAFTLTQQRAYDWTPWFVGLWTAVVVLSVPTLLVPEVGHQRDGQGFQGILNHPQALAVFLVPMVAWYSSKLFFSNRRSFLWLFVFCAIGWALLFLTLARTGIVATGGGLATVLFLMIIWDLRWSRLILRVALNPLTLALVCSLIIFLVVMNAVVWEFLVSFIFKGQKGVPLAESFYSSRGFLFKESWENFLQNPWFGIGFGISDSKYIPFAPEVEPITGLPLEASTEKANILVAVLEETGVIGGVCFSVLFLSLIKHAVAKRDIPLVCVFFACLFTNVGETTFFSVGGLGLYLLLIIAWAISPVSAADDMRRAIGRRSHVAT